MNIAPISEQTIKTYNTDPDGYILQLSTTEEGEPELRLIKKNLLSWIARKLGTFLGLFPKDTQRIVLLRDYLFAQQAELEKGDEGRLFCAHVDRQIRAWNEIHPRQLLSPLHTSHTYEMEVEAVALQQLLGTKPGSTLCQELIDRAKGIESVSTFKLAEGQTIYLQPSHPSFRLHQAKEELEPIDHAAFVNYLLGISPQGSKEVQKLAIQHFSQASLFIPASPSPSSRFKIRLILTP